MANLHRARRLAMQGLCCLDAQGPHALGPMGEFIADSKEPLAVARAAQDLMRGAWDDREACDALLSRHARHWQLSRLALVDRNILRLAVFELRTDRAPFKVVVSEAIRLAREFSSAESPRFINGVLDAVARELGKKNG